MSRVSLVRRIAARLGLAESPWTERAGTERNAGYYDALYDGSAEYALPYHASRYYFIWTVLVDRIRRRPGSRVLEIGCGSGQLAEFLADQGVTSYVGFDFSATAVANARRRGVPGARFEHADALVSDLLETVEYDTVICTEVLEHVAEDLRIMARVRPGTRCLMTVPNFPYESHVRHFQDASEVAARYGPLLGPLDVYTLRDPSSADVRFFLFEGTRGGTAG